MSLVEFYPWLKAFHVAAALTFVGGVLAVSVLLAAAPMSASSAAAIAFGVRRWDQRVTTPAMLVVWGLGLTLATTGHWFADGWLQAKLLFVVVLSGLHGIQSGRLRQLAGGGAPPSSRAGPLIIGCAIIIALLAVAKPF